MARKAKIDFPDIEFNKSIMVGDSESDMQFGKNAGMLTVLIHPGKNIPEQVRPFVDFVFQDLETFAGELTGTEVH